MYVPPLRSQDQNSGTFDSRQVDQDNSDNDSGLGESMNGYSTSLVSSIQNYTYENGRRYHAYRESPYGEILDGEFTELDV